MPRLPIPGRSAPSGRRLATARLAALLSIALIGAAQAVGIAPSAASAPAPAPGPGPDCRRPLTLGLHEHGLLYESQTGVGIDKDIADEMARRTGCRIQTSLMPRARIWQLIESGALDFSLSGISNPERERYASFAWYVSNKYYLLVRRDSHLKSVKDFEDDPHLKLGVIRSFRYGESANRFVDTLADAHRLVYASGLDPLFQVLMEGQVQGMIIEPFDYPTLEGAALRARTVILEFDDPPVLHGLIMSRRSLSPEQQQAWREVIQAMRHDGTIRRIFEKYFPPELARSMTSF